MALGPSRTGIVATIAVIVAIWQTGRANEEPRLKIESVAAGKVIVIGRRSRVFGRRLKGWTPTRTQPAMRLPTARQ